MINKYLILPAANISNMSPMPNPAIDNIYDAICLDCGNTFLAERRSPAWCQDCFSDNVKEDNDANYNISTDKS